jgi:hypothetical protein
MPGRQICAASGFEGAVKTTTFTGIDEKQIICIVSSEPAIKHFVQLRNLRAYETRIICTSQIISKPRFIKFVSPVSEDTADQWAAECTLGNRGEHTFSHVKISTENPDTGDQIIHVELGIDRMRGRNTYELASLQITVSS